MDVSMRSVDSLDRSNRAGLAARWGHTNQLFCHRSSRPTQPAAAAASAYQHTNMGLEDGEVAVEVAEQTVPVVGLVASPDPLSLIRAPTCFTEFTVVATQASGEISSFEWEAINPMVRPVSFSAHLRCRQVSVWRSGTITRTHMYTRTGAQEMA